MYTRSRVVGTGLGTSSVSGDPARDVQRKELSGLQNQKQGLEVAAPKDPVPKSLGRADLRSTGRYTLIAPNENRRQQIRRIAEQELANLEDWKQQNRAKPVHLMPQRLGGSQSESEARQKQQLRLIQSKYQRKLKRDESIQIRKQAEEAELQKMKAIQREKSNKLEEKKRLQENLRREAYREHHQYKTAEFLSKLDTELQNRSALQIAPHDRQSAAWASNQAHKDSLRKEENPKMQKMKNEPHKDELLETRQQQQEEERARIHQAEHRRVNNAFLDRLQGKSQPGGLEQSGGCWNMNGASSWGI